MALEYSYYSIVNINIILRIFISIVAGLIYYIFVFKKRRSFIIKYLIALLFYPISVHYLFEVLINLNFINIVFIKILFDTFYSIIWFFIFKNKRFEKKH
jgi:hypothetical protein